MSQNILTVKTVDGSAPVQIDLSNWTTQTADGRVVTMDLGADDVHIQSALADAVFGFKLADGIADQAMPVIPVPKSSDKYWIFDKNDTYQQAQNVLSAPGGAVQELPQRLSNTPFNTLPYAVCAVIPTEVEANADSRVSPRRAAVRRCMNVLMIAREVRVATALRNAANYGANNKTALAASAKWDGGASSNPVQDLYTRIEAAASPITSVIMSEGVWHDFVQNAGTQKFAAYKQAVPGIPQSTSALASEFSAFLGLPPIVIGAMKSIDPTLGTLQYVWGGDVVLVHQPNGNGVALDGQDISTGYTFRWAQPDGMPSDLAEMSGGFFIRSFFDPKRGPRGATVIVVGHNDAEQFITDYVSGFIGGARQ